MPFRQSAVTAALIQTANPPARRISIDGTGAFVDRIRFFPDGMPDVPDVGDGSPGSLQVQEDVYLAGVPELSQYAPTFGSGVPPTLRLIGRDTTDSLGGLVQIDNAAGLVVNNIDLLNPPSCKAWRSPAVATASGVSATINLNTGALWDSTGSMYDGNAIVVPTDGVYRLTAHCLFSGGVAVGRRLLAIALNGGNLAENDGAMQVYPNNASVPRVVTTATALLAEDDVISVQILQDSGAAGTVSEVVLTVEYVRPPFFAPVGTPLPSSGASITVEITDDYQNLLGGAFFLGTGGQSFIRWRREGRLVWGQITAIVTSDHTAGSVIPYIDLAAAGLPAPRDALLSAVTPFAYALTPETAPAANDGVLEPLGTTQFSTGGANDVFGFVQTRGQGITGGTDFLWNVGGDAGTHNFDGLTFYLIAGIQYEAES